MADENLSICYTIKSKYVIQKNEYYIYFLNLMTLGLPVETGKLRGIHFLQPFRQNPLLATVKVKIKCICHHIPVRHILFGCGIPIPHIITSPFRVSGRSKDVFYNRHDAMLKCWHLPLQPVFTPASINFFWD